MSSKQQSTVDGTGRIEDEHGSLSISRRSALKGLTGAGLLLGVGIPTMSKPVTASHSGSTVYVDASNTSGTEDGSQTNPYNTIQEGVDHANSGDTVLVAAGTYDEGVNVNKSVTLEADGDARNLNLSGSPSPYGFDVTASNVTIRGFTIEGFYFGIQVHAGSDDTVLDQNVINDSIRMGINAARCDRITATNNVITGGQESFEFYEVYDSLVADNQFLDAAPYYGIRLGGSIRNTITRNVIRNEHDAIHLRGSEENLIYDNVFETAGEAVYYDPNNPPAGPDVWNVAPQAGPNIVGGPQIGGNYWSNTTGSGFSDTASDANNDGFADTAYVDGPGGIAVDNYPLVVAPTSISLDIDVKPGNGEETDPINPGAKGNIPVAVYSTDDFDATTLDVTTLRFGSAAVVDAGDGASAVHGGHDEDVDGDGLVDLMLHFPSEDAGFADGDTEAKLVGQTASGTDAVGTDAVKTVGGKGKGKGRGR